MTKSRIIQIGNSASNSATTNVTTDMSVLSALTGDGSNVVPLPKPDLKQEFDRHYDAGKSLPDFLLKHKNLPNDVVIHIAGKARMSLTKLKPLIAFIDRFNDWSDVESSLILIVFNYIGYQQDYSGKVIKVGKYKDVEGNVIEFDKLEKVVRKVYTIFRDYKMPLDVFTIRTVIESEIDHQKSIVRSKIIESIKYDGNNRDAEWEKFVTYYFDTTQHSPKYIAGVLKKFMHQIKVKLVYEDVNQHLMPVIFGPTNKGKSYFVRNILAGPLRQMIKDSNFSKMTDDRVVADWEFPILFLDEMQNASRADVDAIKNRITASSIDYRPMGSNNTASIRNSATFIGTSNADNLAELIRDPTSNRRFAPLYFRTTRPDVEENLGFDFKLLWNSVDVNVDPYNDIRTELEAIQKEHLYHSNVKTWFEDYFEDDFVDRLTFKDANAKYVAWCKDHGEHNQKVKFFNKDLQKLIDSHPDYIVINPKNVLTIKRTDTTQVFDGE